jgi:hypothetical protein
MTTRREQMREVIARYRRRRKPGLVWRPILENKGAKHGIGDNRLPQSAWRSLMAHQRDAQSPKNK